MANVPAAVREILSVIPAGCSWVRPVYRKGRVTDFRIEAVSERGTDVHGRGASRVGELVGNLYPSMVGGPLWQLYEQVLETGVPGTLDDFQYANRQTGIVARSDFEITVHRVLGGLLVWWQRLDEHRLRLERTELLGSLGWSEYDLTTGRVEWSPGMYRIFDRDPARGPMSRDEQGAVVLAEDQGLREAGWQTLESGASSDLTIRVRLGDAVKHLRILSDIARDTDGQPVKVYAVVQNVTARVEGRSAIEHLNDQLRARELTSLAEHRLTAQLQNLIQPVPKEPLRLAGLDVAVSYVPAETATRVGGDWYHAQNLADGSVALAVGDVVGHGLEAANGMAHLRFAFVAWLSIGERDPGTLLRYMNNLCWQLTITGTAAVAVFDPATGVLRWARAGHPAPLLARDGETAELDRPDGLLLGAADDSVYPLADVALSPGDLVLFYTDGLVERRGTGDALLERVTAAMSAVSGADDPLLRLRERLDWASPDDDTCTLALRVLPADPTPG